MSYLVLIHIIFVVSCELRIGMYREFFVCRNLLCGFLVIEVLVLVSCSVAQNQK